MKPLLVSTNPGFFKKILTWHNIQYQPTGNLFKFKNFDSYNNMIAINEIFSSAPTNQPIDRTGLVHSPINYYLDRPWVIPTQQLTLDQVLHERVNNLLKMQHTVNLCWSGGIDSTTMVTAFLKHAPDKKKLRILYSPHSTYEHPDYLAFLKTFSDIELVDTSGTIYLNSKFDGIFVTGDGGDELMGSLDKSFFTKYGYNSLYGHWKDFFWQINADSNFIEFCERHFAQSGRPIETVLEARWWFYATCKNTSLLYDLQLPHFLDYDNFNINHLHGFFDCEEFEKFIYWNTDKIINSSEYCTWKQVLKDYCCGFDGFTEWAKTKSKAGSNQFQGYTLKKLLLKDRRWIMILSDATRIATSNLPFLTKKDYRTTYGHQLDYLFNEPN
jgi:hypothetical protein